jgi:stearoyl-CoA desaturase (delta-9 desaturase)
MSVRSVARNRLLRSKDERINWIKSIPFFTVHAIPLAAIWTGASSFDWWLCFWLYVVRMFAITGGNHRYFAHKSYYATRFFQFVMAFLGTSAAQKGVLWWAEKHRYHHRWSDQAEDIHSTKRHGFWYAHVGWVLNDRNHYFDGRLVQQFLKFPELRLMNQSPWMWFPPVGLGAAVFFLRWWAAGLTAGFSALLVGFFLSTVILYHGTFFINSLAHMLGTHDHQTHPDKDKDDTSGNSWILAIVTLGEGWHNDHHFKAQYTKQGIEWWKIDITYYALWLLQGVGYWRFRKADDGSRKREFVHLLVWNVSQHPLNEKEYSTAA